MIADTSTHRRPPLREERPRTADEDLRSLVGQLTHEASNWIRQETALAKAEITEKVHEAGKGAVMLLAGALVLYAGVVVLLLAAAMLVGEVLKQSAGFEPVQAYLTGLGSVGLLVCLSGWIAINKARAKFSSDHLTPEKTAETLKDAKHWAESKIK